MVLKVMHAAHHADAREFKSWLNISDRELYHLVEDKAEHAIEELR
jgi:succinate dehydrogenase flavin-adding protein (antitoxin of CptAB toxin-antitoxin module)